MISYIRLDSSIANSLSICRRCWEGRKHGTTENLLLSTNGPSAEWTLSIITPVPQNQGWLWAGVGGLLDSDTSSSSLPTR